MTTLAVAIIVSAAKRLAVMAAVAAATPDHTIAFYRPCCAIDEPNLTWETPPTHFYTNGTEIPADVVHAWQDAVSAADPADALHGLVIFTGLNGRDAEAWAATNLNNENLQFIPDEE